METKAKIHHHYDVWCYGSDGNLKWYDYIDNIVTTAGMNKYLDSTLKTGVTSPTWFVGLVGPTNHTYNAADIMSSHGGWTEDATYDEATRVAFTPGTISAGSVSNSASKAVFTISGSTTIQGCFLVNQSTKSGTTGDLLGEGDFTGGAKTVVDNDVLNVQVTCSIA
jgi:hypothetical protein